MSYTWPTLMFEQIKSHINMDLLIYSLFLLTVSMKTVYTPTIIKQVTEIN